MSKPIYTKEVQVLPHGTPLVLLEAQVPFAFPEHLCRISPRKANYLVRKIAQVERRDTVLELFGGTGLTTVLLAQKVSNPEKITSVDLHYSFERGTWRYAFEENYRRLANYLGLVEIRYPKFISADVRELPFPKNSFDVVIAPDSPRTRRTTGDEWGLTPQEQLKLFRGMVKEAKRLLIPGGVFAATAPVSWTDYLPFDNFDVQYGSSVALRFASGNDPIVYIRARG